MSDKTVSINGKTYDYGDMTDEQLEAFYAKLQKREEVLFEKIVKYQTKYDFLPDLTLDDLIV